MDYHQVLKIGGGLLTLLLFIPMIALILKEGAAGQSCVMWMLWGALDTILTVSILQQRGNFLLPLGFAIGDVLVTGLLVAKGKFQWGWFESAILALVIGCVAAWKFSGSRTATIAATLGICIAGVPGLVAMLKQPQRKLGNVWLGYVLANVLSFFGGTAMIVEERFAPGVFALCALMMFAASRKSVAT